MRRLYFHALIVEKSNDHAVDDEFGNNNAPGHEERETDPCVFKSRMLVRLEIRVEFSLLAWDWNIAPVAHRTVLLSEEDDQGGYERKAEAPEQVAELDFGSEESAWKEVVFVIAIENN